MIGRRDVRASVQWLLREALGGPSSLLIEGPGGMGRTEAWRFAIAEGNRAGYLVIASQPNASDTPLAFTVLRDLFDQVSPDVLEGLPSPLGGAMESVLFRASPDAPGLAPDAVAVVRVAVLESLRLLAMERPVLVAVDDVESIDPPSENALTFALPRLTNQPIAVFGTARTDGEHAARPWLGGVVPDERQRRLRLLPLSEGQVSAVIQKLLHRPVPRPVLRELYRLSGGVPQVALELAREWSLAPASIPRTRLSVPNSLASSIRQTLSPLPSETILRLQLAGVLSHPTPHSVEKAVQLLSSHDGRPDDQDPWVPAFDADIVRLEDGVILFTNPLVPEVLHADLSAHERRTLHARLLDVVEDPVERAHHLAFARVSPDPSLASDLSTAAATALVSGSPEGAGDLWELASERTPKERGNERARFLVDAAHAWSVAGDPGRSRLLLERALEALRPGVERAEALRRLARVRFEMDSQSAAVVLLHEALSQPDIDPIMRATLERDLTWMVAARGEIDAAAAHAREALEFSRAAGLERVGEDLLAALTYNEFLRGETSARDRLLTLHPTEFDGSIETNPRLLYALCLKWSDEFGEARRLLEEMLADAKDAREETAIPFPLLHLAELEVWSGQWNTANRYAIWGLRSVTQSGRQPLRAQLMYVRGLVQAHLGNEKTARRFAEQGANLASTVGSPLAWLLNEGALGFLDMSLGRPVDAAEHLGPMLDVLSSLGIEEPGVVRFVPDAIEAFIGTGELARASSVLDEFELRAERIGRVSAEAAALRCRGLLTAARGDLAEAGPRVQEAVARHRQQPQPLELGRSLFAHGLVLRRARRQSAARASLLEAAGVFQRLGARLWTDQVEAVLSRGTGTRRDPGGLTPAELRVGELVASGATNQEAAHRLFLSVRAVEAHLTNIYRKLGVRSRTELTARLLKSGR